MTKKEEHLKESLDHYLKDFQSDNEAPRDRFHESWTRIDLEPNEAPLAYMVFISLVVLKGYPYSGRGEKVLWSIPLEYKSYSMLISYTKFGLALYYRGVKPPQDTVKEMIRQLNKASRVVDRLMQPFAEKQVQSGNVTVANRYVRLHMRYQFFRRKAGEAFSRAEKGHRLAKKRNRLDFMADITSDINYRTRKEHEAWYYTIAMLDSYFSRLEHLLVLIMPFLQFDCTQESLVDLISAPWKDKYKRAFDVGNDRTAKNYFDRLIAVKEKYRNTITHGDFEKGGASLYFNLQGLGAIPVRMSSFKDSIYYSFFPIDAESYRDICALLDEVDAFLRSGKTKYGVRFAESGLDVAFDRRSVEEYSRASKSDANFQSFLEYTAYWDTIWTNMDF